MALVAAAGPATNFLLALAALAVLVHTNVRGEAAEVTYYAYLVNVVLGLFNLIPFPPSTAPVIVGVFMSDDDLPAVVASRRLRDDPRAGPVPGLPRRVVPAARKRLRSRDQRDGANRRCLSLAPPAARRSRPAPGTRG